MCWLVGVVLAAPMALAQTSWKGTSSTAWSTAANWTAGVPTASLDAIIGDANFTGTKQPNISGTSVCRSLTLGTGTKACTLTISRTLTVSGNVTIGANGRIAHTASSTARPISLTGNWTNSGFYAGSSTSSSVTFSGTAQSIGGSVATGFRRLNINAGSTTTLGANISVTNALSVSGTLDPGAGSGLVISGAGTMTVASGGSILVRASTFAGNYTISGTKTLSAGSTVDYAASGNQTVANTFTYSTLRISGSGVKTLAGNLPSLVSSSATAGAINVAAGTLDLSSYTANRGTSVAGGTISVSAGATLRIGGTGTFPVNYATHSLASTSTVEYNGNVQTVTAEAYGSLTLSGTSGAVIKTMPASTMTVAGNLIANLGAATTVAFTAGGALTVNGNLSLGSGTTFDGSSFSHTIGGNWTNNGTFTGTSSTITMNGVNSVLTGAGANNFFNLTIARSGITADLNTSLDVAGAFATTGAGTFTHTPGGTGTVTMSGTSKAISGTGIAFSKLTISGTGSTTTSASFTVADNLTVNGSLTATAGTISLTGSGKQITGSGAIAFYALSVPGSITATSGFSLASDLGVAGSFTSTAGMVTFVGSTTVSGTASLFNSTLNGTLLRLASGSMLRLGGTTTLTAGTFDASSQTPNTIVYNGASAQTVFPITYYNLEIASGGAKTAGGNLTVLGTFTNDASAVFNGGSGSYTIYVQGDWGNAGTFNAGNNTVEFYGSSDATISGANTFNVLRVNKGSSSVLVHLGASQTTATLDMALGTINTGANTLTITTTRINSGIVLGTITRQHTFAAATDYAFESPYTTVNFASLGTVTSVTMTATPGTVADFPFGGSVNRQYTVAIASSGSYSATLRLHYEDAELNGTTESSMNLWRNSGSSWSVVGKTANDATANWVEQTSITTLPGRWTFSDDTYIVAWNGSISTAWETAGNWTVVQGSPSRPPAITDIVELGTIAGTYQPMLSSSATVKSISFGSVQGATLTLGTSGSLQTIGNVGGSWNSSATHAINVGAQSLNVGGSLTLSDGTTGHAINLSLSSGAVTVTNTLVESGGANITFTGAGTLSIFGDFAYTSGTFNPGSGTVIYTGSGAQVVAGVTYNHFVMNMPSGISTLSASATVNGNLTLMTGGTLRLNAPMSVAGNVTIQAGTTLDPGSAVLSVGGNWSCSGTFVPNSAEVIFNGTGAQSIGASTFYDLDVNKSAGIATLAGNILVNVDADISNGTLDLATYTLGRASAGANLTLAAGATMRVGNNFPSDFASVSLDPASTVTYYGTGAQNVAAETYGHLILTNGTSNAKTLAGPITVGGNLTIANNATLAAGSSSLTLLGNWTNSGAFGAGSGTVILGGTNKTVAGATTFNNLTVTGTNTVADCDITIHGNVTILGGYAAGSGSHTIDGDLYNSGAMSSTGTTTFTGTRLQTISLLTPIQSVSSGVVNFNGTVSPVLNSSAGPQFANVNINNTGGVTASVGWTVFFQFNIGSGAAFNGSSFSHAFYGTVANSGTMTSSGTLNFSPAIDTTLLLGNGFSSAGVVVFSGTNHITLSSGALSLGSVEVANTHAAGITPVSNWTLAGDLQVDAGATFHAGASLTHTIGGSLNNNGTFDGGTSLMIFNGTCQTTGNGSTVFGNLQVSSSLTCLSPISVTGNFINNGTFDGTGVDVSFTGSAASSIAGTTTPTYFDSLVVAKSSATVTLGLNVNNLTALAISSGTLDTATYTVSEDPVNYGTLNVGASGTLKLGGANVFPTFTSGATLNPGSTVEYSGSAQTVAPITYSNLRLSGTGNKTLNATTTINGNVDISGTAKFNLNYSVSSFSQAGSLTFGGALQPAGTWGSTSSAATHQNNTYFQGTGYLNAGTRTLDHFAVTTPGTQTAGTAFSITTITAQDANNNTVNFTGTVDLTETGDGAGGTVTPSQSGAFTAGVLAGQSVTLTNTGAAVTITVADHAGTGKSGVTDPFTVNPAALHHYAVTFSAPPFYAGIPFTTYATAKDAYNNTITSGSGSIIMFSSSSTNMTWDGCTQGSFNNYEPDELVATNFNGVASIATEDDTAETGVTISAFTNGITGTSAAIDITLQTDAYRSHQSGSWNSASTWERYNGSSWVAASTAPTYANGVITVQASHTVTVTADVSVDQVIVARGGQISVNNGVTLTVVNNTAPGLQIYGSLTNNGSLVIAGGAQLSVQAAGALVNSGTVTPNGPLQVFAGGIYRHLFATTAGTIPAAQWRPGSICEIAGYTSNTSPPGGLGQAFYDFIWNCPSQAGGINLGASFTNVGNHFNVTNTGGGSLTLGANLAVTNTATVSSEGQLYCGPYKITGSGFTLGSGGTLGIGSADGITSSGTNGNIITTTRTFDPTANYVFNGTTAQTTGSGLPSAVNSLTIANTTGSSSDVTLSGNVTVSTAFNLTTGSLVYGGHALALAGGVTITRDTGSLATAPTFGSSVNVIYSGPTPVTAGSEIPTSSTVLQGLTIGKSGGVALSANININSSGTITLTSGLLTTGNYQVNVANTANNCITVGSGCWINGTLQKAFDTGNQSFTFPIGGSGSYRPVTLANLNVTTAGTLAAMVTGSVGNHPQIATSGINPNHDVTRYWTLIAGNGLVVASCDATFTFVASDVSAGGNTSLFAVRRYSGSAWSVTAIGTRTSTSTAATGLSAFGDFIIGEPMANRMIVTLPGESFTSGSGNSGTVSSQTAGASFTITLSAVDIFNVVDAAYSGLKTISYSGPGNAPGGAAPIYSTGVTFASGQAALVATTLKKAETPTITATDGVLTGVASSSLLVAPAAASQLVFTTSPFSVPAGQASSSITVQRQDPFGNPNTADATRSVTLSSSSSGTVTFNPVSPLSIASGSSTASFTYTDSKAGTPTITASSASPTTVTSAAQQETVNVGAVSASASTLEASPTSVTADGTTTSTITVTLKDASGNPVSGKSVSLTKTSGAGTPTITTVANVTDANGQGSWTVKSTTAAADVFTATDTTDNTTVSHTATVTFTAGAVTHYAISFSSPPFYVGVPFTTTITAKDAYNNTVTSGSGTSDTVTLSSSTLNMKWDGNSNGTYDNAPPENQVTLSSGVGNILTKDNTAETGVTITATGLSFSGTSASIAIVAQTGSYRSRASGDWNNPTTWQYWDGSAWQDSTTTTPTSSDGVITILSAHTVTVTADVSVDQVIIENGGAVVVNAGNTLTVVSAASPDLEVRGSLNNNGTVTVGSGATVAVYDTGVMVNAGTVNSSGSYGTLRFYGGTYQHNFTTTAGTIPAAFWSANNQKSTCALIGYTSNSGTPGGLGQNFLNFVWNCPSQTGNIGLGGSQFSTVDTFTVSSTGSGAITLGASLTLTNSATVSSGAALDCGGYVISEVSGRTASYFDLQSGATLGIGSADGITSSGAFGNIQTTTRSFSSGANYIYNGTTTPQATGTGLPANVEQLIINNTASSGTVTLSQNVDVNDTLFLTAGTLSIGAHTLTVNNAISAAGGTLIGGSSSIMVIGDTGSSASTTLPAVASGLQNLTVSRANGVTLGGGVTVSGTVALASGAVGSANNLTLATGSSISRATGSLSGTPTFSGTVSVTYTAGGVTTGTELPISTGNVLQALSFAQSSGVVTLGASATANGAVTIGSGASLADGGFTLTAKGNVVNSGTHTSTGSGRILLTGGSASHALSGTGSYGNLELNDAQGASLSAATTLAGTLTLTAGMFANGTCLTLADGVTISRATGTLGAIPTFGSTVNVTYTGTSGVTASYELPGTSTVLNNLTLSYSSPVTLTVAAGRTVNGNLTINSSSTLADAGYVLSVIGDVYNSGTHSGSGKISLNDPYTQTLFGSGTYGNLQLTSGDAYLAGSPTITGTLTLPSAGAFVVGANALTLNGPTIAGTAANLVTTLSSSLAFGGSSMGVQIPGSVAELNSLTINNVNGVTMNSTMEVVGYLALSSGTLNTGDNIFHVHNPGNASITRASGWINGTLCKAFSPGTGQSFTYPIGDATTFRPVDFNNMTVSVAGEVQFKLISGQEPNMAGSGLSSGKALPFYWKGTAIGRITLDSLAMTMHFASGDVPALADSSRFAMRMWFSDTSGWMNWPITSRTGTSITAAGLLRNGSSGSGANSYGDFVVGEPLASRMIVTLPGETFTSGSGNSGTVSAQTSGSPFNLTLSAVDLFNTLDSSYSGSKTISYSGPGNSPGGVAPDYTTSLAFSGGQATPVATTLKKAETTTITATDGSLTGVTSSSLTVGPASANKLAFTTQPDGGAGGAVWTTQPAVTLQDASGNTVIGTSQNVTVAIQNNAATSHDGILSGTTTVAVDTGTGVAVFGGLSIDKVGVGYTLTAIGDTVSQTPGVVVSGSFNISKDSGHAYKITAATTTPNGGAGDQLTITLLDADGNTVTGFDGDKTLTFSGLATAGDGTHPIVTDQNGSGVNLGTSEAITFARGVSSSANGAAILKAYKVEIATLNVSDSGGLASTSTGGAGVSLTIGNVGPVAGTDTLMRARNVALRIPMSSLTSVSDANHDSLSFVGASTLSSAGASVYFNSRYLLYNVPPGGNVSDSFTYTVSDGTLTATGTVNITVQPDSSGQGYNIIGASSAGGVNTITFAGIPGRTYVIQRATTLSSPDWSDVGTIVAPSGGLFQYTDGPVPAPPSPAFYRARIQ